ncbi:NADPH-dependent FMN reductase-domain-containing protein [Mycena polygramma]|nr:NADPH-dependent FMN reductase-domain-containing protein [Mycena polygramma]
MSCTTPKRVALIIASVRSPRLGTTIARVIFEIISRRLPKHVTLTLVDLKDYPLPMYTTDPIIPAGIPRPIAATAYADPATNAWSAVVQGFDAFIFVTPQYNWGYPASLKLALDALYHEWTGKPALVVSYGNRGGGKSAGQLRQVLEGLHMPVCTRGVELAFAEGHDRCGGEIEEATHKRWRKEDKKEELASLIKTQA